MKHWIRYWALQFLTNRHTECHPAAARSHFYTHNSTNQEYWCIPGSKGCYCTHSHLKAKNTGNSKYSTMHCSILCGQQSTMCPHTNMLHTMILIPFCPTHAAYLSVWFIIKMPFSNMQCNLLYAHDQVVYSVRICGTCISAQVCIYSLCQKNWSCSVIVMYSRSEKSNRTDSLLYPSWQTGIADRHYVAHVLSHMCRRVIVVDCVCVSSSIFPYSNKLAKKAYGSPQCCKRFN